MFGTKSIVAAALIAAGTILAPTAQADDKAHDAMTKTKMAGDLHLSGYWTRAMLPGQKVGGGFLVIANKGAADDRLVAVATPHTDRAEIHEMAVVDDVMKMRRLDEGLKIPAGESVVLEPGGFHLMFMAVETPFKEGEMVPVTVTFERAGDVELMLPVMPAGSKKMDHGAHSN
ncbi:MAG: copper chaperone PCu(A)C [Alphaproteobacteria bacterium]|nr:copper chaperone PCu(A)C [Alphaproteobacteria bacterium]